MLIELPEVDFTKQNNWSIASQLRKIGEEYGEVAEAVAQVDPVNAVREALDLMQTCATLICMIQVEYNLNFDRLKREHVEKLRRKGYLKEEGI